MLIAVVFVSICIDIDFLLSNFFPEPINEDINSLRMDQDESLTRLFALYGIIFNIGLKPFSLVGCLNASSRGRNIRNRMWERGHVLLPPLSHQIPEDLNNVIQSRAIAIAWIELICCVLYFACIFSIEMDWVSSTAFQEGTNISLEGSLILKATSGVIVLLSLRQHINMKDFWSHFGCRIRSNSGSPTNASSSAFRKSLRCIFLTKSIDFSIAVLIWIKLVQSRDGIRWNAPKDLKAMTDLILAITLFTHILTPLLLAVVS